jgi:outer membrane protein TolC
MSQICEIKRNIWEHIHLSSSNLKVLLIVFIGIISTSFCTKAQNKSTPGSPEYLSLDQCIVYALQNQPAVKQSLLEVSIVRKVNTINLSSWLPQINLSGSFTHYDPLPTILVTNSSNPTDPLIQEHNGIVNTFLPQLTATQTIINPDVLNAARTAHLYVQEAKQSNDSTKINLIAHVSKSFYSLLFTLEQMNVLEEDTARLSKTLQDAYHQYVGGIVDKTDYKEATIALNNSIAQLKQAQESVRPQYALLKGLMGFPPEKDFIVSFDTVQMMKDINFDTAQQLQYENRIEYQQLQTVKSLQQLQLRYYKNQFLPSLSAFYNYTYEFEKNSIPGFLNQGYPYSYMGASVSVPIFTGWRRMANIQKTKLEGEQIDLAIIGLRSFINSEYTAALATYKSSLYDLFLDHENMAMAKDVYGVVSLQYKQGFVAYLNVITAESNLISSEISYLNALFQVLSSKIDLEKAMGKIHSK